ECVVVTLFYRRDFLFSIYTKYFTLSLRALKLVFIRYLNAILVLINCYQQQKRSYLVLTFEQLLEEVGYG
ncbi:hypothetical protein, partial [Enterococcus faecium]|uniref:hypothetical protein n=1 Tax=Enterococcus faecium TaxID=1352 RepID=UPI003D23DFFF